MERAGSRKDQGIPLPPFTRHGYRQLITALLAAGYTPTTFDSVRPRHRDLIVRHDVDVSLDAALSIAELEHEIGVQATYFVMVSSSFYNLFSPDSQRQVARLSELRHRIGLHFDVSAYRFNSLGDYSDQAARELALLAGIVRDAVEIVSFHNPHPELVNRERATGKLAHTYEPRFFSELAYVADSGGAWRFGGPFERPAFSNGTAIHLLTHPIWWVHDEPTAAPEFTLKRFADDQRARLEQNLAAGFKAYREYLRARSA
jgi:hypothetical protein